MVVRQQNKAFTKAQESLEGILKAPLMESKVCDGQVLQIKSEREPCQGVGTLPCWLLRFLTRELHLEIYILFL